MPGIRVESWDLLWWCPSTLCDGEINLIEFALTKIFTLNIINPSGARGKIVCVCVCVLVQDHGIRLVKYTFNVMNTEEKGWNIYIYVYSKSCSTRFPLWRWLRPIYVAVVVVVVVLDQNSYLLVVFKECKTEGRFYVYLRISKIQFYTFPSLGNRVATLPRRAKKENHPKSTCRPCLNPRSLLLLSQTPFIIHALLMLLRIHAQSSVPFT